MRRCIAFAAFAVVALLRVVDSQAQVGEAVTPQSPPPRLKPSPILEPPASKPLTPQPAAADHDAIFLRADRLEGEGQKWIEAQGKVELRTRRQTVLADWLRYDAATDEIWGKGNVTLRRGIDWVTGPELKFKRGDETGFFAMPEFHIGENASRGDAREVIFAGPNHDQLKDVRYTTCVAGNEDWYLRALDVDLDKSRQVGVAHDTTVYFKGTPILYSPYLSFPLSNERKSGFLTPVYGSSNQRGFEITQPYYLNLAPNYDATILARPMTRRGVQMDGQFRYLFAQSNGEADAEYLPYDRVTGTDRYALAWKHNHDFGQGLSGFINAQKVSDNTYFADLSDRLALTSQTNLPRIVGLGYTRGPFSLLTQVQTFQTLQDPNNPITPPYFREPQFLLTMRPVEWQGLDFEASGEFVRFRQPALSPNGDRMFLYPTVSWSKNGSWWFFNAQTGLQMTHYDLDNPAPPPTSFNRVLPITTVESGIVFERDAEWFGRKFIQTLEPRAYYVNIPFRNQSNYPIFDTAQDDFNFSQLFTANRYLGWDRIGDANQMTLALQSRFLDPETGAERMRFAVGQRYYFESQQVTLNEPPRTSNSSDILIYGESRLSDVWTAAGLLNYQPSPRQTEELDLGGRYQPAPGKVFNLLYRYIRQYINSSGQVSQLKQIDASGQWPISDNWSVIGRWNYSLVDAKTLEGVVGFEYNGGCWVFRLAAQRLQTNTQQVSNSVFVQLELNGLARLGTNPVDVFLRNVPGYTTANDPTARPGGETPGAADFFPRF
ncbi:MAG: LPS-assembly protein LptD [Betaproteobacteria bacterium]|nr:MAG: LPS-assembly protein LptD [Betaproteobacteria bacterium]